MVHFPDTNFYYSSNTSFSLSLSGATMDIMTDRSFFRARTMILIGPPPHCPHDWQAIPLSEGGSLLDQCIMQKHRSNVHTYTRRRTLNVICFA